MMLQGCCCTGPMPGHGLCPCQERLELERRRIRDMGLPTDLDRCNLWHTINGETRSPLLQQCSAPMQGSSI